MTQDVEVASGRWGSSGTTSKLARARWLLPFVAVLLAVSLLPSEAIGSRVATPQEARAINKRPMAACKAFQRSLGSSGTPCHVLHPSRVSTVNSHYAYSNVVGEQWSGALLRRKSAHGKRWHIVATQGSGVNSCSYWTRHAPPGVIFDFKLIGVLDSDGNAGRCGHRAGRSGRRALIQSHGRGVYKPTEFCPANHTCFSDAHWIRWGSTAVAWATGTTAYPLAPEISQRVKVTFSEARGMCGGSRYTHARWRYRGNSRPTETTFMALSDCGIWTGG